MNVLRVEEIIGAADQVLKKWGINEALALQKGVLEQEIYGADLPDETFEKVVYQSFRLRNYRLIESVLDKRMIDATSQLIIDPIAGDDPFIVSLSINSDKRCSFTFSPAIEDPARCPPNALQLISSRWIRVLPPIYQYVARGVPSGLLPINLRNANLIANFVL